MEIMVVVVEVEVAVVCHLKRAKDIKGVMLSPTLGQRSFAACVADVTMTPKTACTWEH